MANKIIIEIAEDATTTNRVYDMLTVLFGLLKLRIRMSVGWGDDES